MLEFLSVTWPLALCSSRGCCCLGASETELSWFLNQRWRSRATRRGSSLILSHAESPPDNLRSASCNGALARQLKYCCTVSRVVWKWRKNSLKSWMQQSAEEPDTLRHLVRGIEDGEGRVGWGGFTWPGADYPPLRAHRKLQAHDWRRTKHMLPFTWHIIAATRAEREFVLGWLVVSHR